MEKNREQNKYRPRNSTNSDYYSLLKEEFEKLTDPYYTVSRVIRGTGEVKSVVKDASEEFKKNLKETFINGNKK